MSALRTGAQEYIKTVRYRRTWQDRATFRVARAGATKAKTITANFILSAVEVNTFAMP